MEAEVENKGEGKMEEATSNGELLSHVQELKDELRDSERKRMNLIQANTALQNILKASREEESRTRQEMASLKEKLVFGGATSQVSRIELGLEAPDKPSRVLCVMQAFLILYRLSSLPNSARLPLTLITHGHLQKLLWRLKIKNRFLPLGRKRL